VAATGDETLIEGGKRGLGMIYSGQKSGGLTRADVITLNRERAAAGFGPTQPVLLTWMFCARSEQQARERVAQATDRLLFDLTNNYAQTVWDRFDRAAGYDAFVRDFAASAGADDVNAVDAFIDKQIWGTPAQCLEKVRALQQDTGARNISFQVQYGDVTHDEALAHMTLFAQEALDKLHTIPTEMPAWLIELFSERETVGS
jgi:alkanesulfonate monooxygenase SsuD/methylene tetrahydromethanopterin reductase-like flavin-dependent oxidoreductase (luciferase family)